MRRASLPPFIERIVRPPLNPRYYVEGPMLLSRKDTRKIAQIVVSEGLRDRQFSGREKDLRRYLQTNQPKIGYGSIGYDNLPSLIDWQKDVPHNIHTFVTSPKNRIIDAAYFVQDNNVGSIPEPMSSQMSASELLNERELIVLEDVAPDQFIVSVDHSHLDRLKEGKQVPNQLHELALDISVPKLVRIQDFSNLTAILKACVDDKCYVKGAEIARLIKPEVLVKEARANQYSKSATEELQKFAESARSEKKADRSGPTIKF